jgi:hypothetical protein
VRRRDREAREREAAALARQHAEIRERLLDTIERTDRLGDDLLDEVHRWAAERKETP